MFLRCPMVRYGRQESYVVTYSSRDENVLNMRWYFLCLLFVFSTFYSFNMSYKLPPFLVPSSSSSLPTTLPSDYPSIPRIRPSPLPIVKI